VRLSNIDQSAQSGNNISQSIITNEVEVLVYLWGSNTNNRPWRRYIATDKYGGRVQSGSTALPNRCRPLANEIAVQRGE